MEILSQGKDVYDKINYCQLCGCVFKTNRDDAIVFFENDVCKHYVECPSCFSLLLQGFTKQMIIKKDDEIFEK